MNGSLVGQPVSKATQQAGACGHKCHTIGLNVWIHTCPICYCANRNYDPTIPVPEDFPQLIDFLLNGYSFINGVRLHHQEYY